VNGKGYPQGLSGDQIPMQAKIVSVADTFDAMTIDRPYQKALALRDALSRLKDFVDTRYDGAVVEALIQACDAGEVANGIVRQRARILEQVEDTSEAIAATNNDLLDLGDDAPIPHAAASDNPLELGL
jgi:HD-GYP domain-containing protein (c-di-GMP phosphodiesterase class II)